MAYSFYYVCLVVLAIAYMCNSAVVDSQIDSYNVLQSKSISPIDYQKKVIAAWTPSRMRAAKPIEEIHPFLKITKSNSDNTAKQLFNNLESPVMVSGTLPDNTTLLNRAYSLTERIVKTVGKVFFETPTGDATCSASVVTSPSLSLIVTAAHCVFDLRTHTWMSHNWMFAPAYDTNVYPLGVWVGKYFTALTGYTGSSTSSPGWNYDVAFVVALPNSNKRLAQVTGSQGIGFSLGYAQPIMSFGYPANIANAELMSNCFSKGLAGKCGVRGYVGQALRCGMTQGCSGGPWIQSFNQGTGLGYVVSVNSYGCNNYMLHGPYFGTYIKGLYDSVKSKV